MNNVVLIGRLTRDPEIKHFENQNAVCNFTLAVDKELSKEKKQEFESKGQPTADFINIVVWGKQAENCVNHLAKGLLTGVQGRLQSRSYEGNDGIRRYVTEVVAGRVEFLEWKDEKKDEDDTSLGIDGFQPVDDSDIPF